MLNDKNETIYPPNEEGWNPNRQELPFNVGKLKLAIEAEEPIDK